MQALCRFVALGILLCLAAVEARCQGHASIAPSAPPGATVPFSRIPRVVRAPKLDDFLESREREAELVVTDFRQNVPGDGEPASETTTAYLSYDQKNLYVIFHCKDSSGDVRAHLSKREDLEQDDGVGLFLDTFYDKHRAYYYFSN